MRAYERFIEYVKVNTMSDPNSETLPSSKIQFDLANLLVQEMREIGISNVEVDEKCYVYGEVPASEGYENMPAIGFIAHMDTAPDFSGENVKPVIHENYDGGDVKLPNGKVIETAVFPELKKLVDRTLITASGDTLLGSDDKAGIAEILTACEQIINENIPHGKICIAFTPDEEIGEGATGFDVQRFGAPYAYTVDGGIEGEIEFETFNAADARLLFRGVNVHPGTAKNIMRNAQHMAMEFNAFLPKGDRPEHTEGREGFFHLCDMEGDVEKAILHYIVRDHDRQIFEKRKDMVKKAAAEIDEKYGGGAVELQIRDSYYNMREVIEENWHLVENAEKAIRKAELEPIMTPVRGGTDGSRLSFMGLPCPNLGTGGMYCHGPNECISAEGMDKAVEIILNIIEIYSAG
jgi:peptidase T